VPFVPAELTATLAAGSVSGLEITWDVAGRGHPRDIGPVQDIAIRDLVEGGLVDPARHLDPEKVERYARVLDELPPVTVFQLPEGLLLVDGYHRLAAARRRGRLTVAARLLQGSREDALRYAIDLAAAERALRVDAVRAAIERRSAGRWGAELPPTPDAP
jgi:hypothetical protein